MQLSSGALSLSPPIFLAPLAGITDLPFRQIVSRFGAGMVVSEMVASQDMVIGRAGTREKTGAGLVLASLRPGDRRLYGVSVQP